MTTKGARASVTRTWVMVGMSPHPPGWAPGCACKSLRCVSCSHVLETRDASTKHAMSYMRQSAHALSEARQRGSIAIGPAVQVLDPFDRDPAPLLLKTNSASRAGRRLTVVASGQILQPVSCRSTEEADANSLPSMRKVFTPISYRQKRCSKICAAQWGATHRASTKGWTISSTGCKLILKKDHPNASRYGYVQEHRLVMEKKLGRYLTAGNWCITGAATGWTTGSAIWNLMEKRQHDGHRKPVYHVTCPHCQTVFPMRGNAHTVDQMPEWATPATLPCVVLDCFAGAGKLARSRRSPATRRHRHRTQPVIHRDGDAARCRD